MLTIMDTTSYHDMPGESACPNLCGMTLRKALSELRDVSWGDRGGMEPAPLSDGSYLYVRLTPDSGGGVWMSSQRAERLAPDGFTSVRTYPLLAHYLSLTMPARDEATMESIEIGDRP